MSRLPALSRRRKPPRAEPVPWRLRLFPKECACGASWSADAWLALASLGIMDDGVDRLELRSCTCGSTIAMLAEDVEQIR